MKEGGNFYLSDQPRSEEQATRGAEERLRIEEHAKVTERWLKAKLDVYCLVNIIYIV